MNDEIDKWLPCNNNQDIYIYLNKLFKDPLLCKKIFTTTTPLTIKNVKRESEDKLRKHIENYYRNIIQKSIIYNDLFTKIRIDFFKKQYNRIFTCYIDNMNYTIAHDLVYKNNDFVRREYKIIEITNNNILVSENIETKEKYRFIYNSKVHRWQYMFDTKMYIVDYTMNHEFISQNILIGSKVQITNINLSHLNVVKHSYNLLSDIVTIKTYDTSTEILTVEFNYNHKKNASLLHIPNSFFKKYCVFRPDKIHLTFQLYNPINTICEFRYKSAYLVYDDYKEEVDLLPLNLNNIYIHNIEFMNQSIQQYQFNQFIKSKKDDTIFPLQSFYGTELFNIMGSYI